MVLFYLCYWYNKTHFLVSTKSMEPTIKKGQCIKISSFNKIHGISRWDIVAIKFPKDKNTISIRRVVGLPKERIAIFNTNIEINGERLELIPVLGNKIFNNSGSELTTSIPDDCLYVIGDNVEGSLDSRHYGCVPIIDVMGIVKMEDAAMFGK